jgi:hypothetical protein
VRDAGAAETATGTTTTGTGAPVDARADLHGADRAVGDLRHRLQRQRRHGPAGPSHHVIRKRSRNYLLHLVVPLSGFGIIGYALTQADTNAKVGGVVWLAAGALVFLYFLLTGRSRELTIGEGA